jgi:hypothetical protein
MKMLKFGCGLLMSGSVMFGLGFIAGAIYNYGNNVSLWPTTVGALFLLAGLVLSLLGVFSKKAE